MLRGAYERNSMLTTAPAMNPEKNWTDLDRHTGSMVSQGEEHPFPKQSLKASVELDF